MMDESWPKIKELYQEELYLIQKFNFEYLWNKNESTFYQPEIEY